VSPNEASGDPAAYEIAYREAVRAIAAQGASLDGLRTRAGIVLSATAIVAGFLGPVLVRLDVLGQIAVVLFVIASVGAIALLLPIGEWRGSTNAQDLISAYIEADPPASLPEIHRSLAYYMQDHWVWNEHKLVQLNRVLAASAGAVAGAIIVALVAIARG
jgi:hypothetical protein